VRSEM